MTNKPSRRNMLFGSAAGLATYITATHAQAQTSSAPRPAQPATSKGGAGRKPNIVVIMGDDIGYWNISYNSGGMMGFRTPGIDRVFAEGTRLTDHYGEQSCTAGRSAFITGQMTVRTGMSKVGFPGADLGIRPEDPTLAELLKPLGYTTGQFGKNHLGDRNEFLPTVHGFDEFFGNLYHLNAEDTPEDPAYPKDPAFRAQFGPRGVLRTRAADRDDPTVDPRFGRVGRQTIEDTGPLTSERQKNVDTEFLNAATDFIDRQHRAGQPFFCWFNSSRMHYRTHVGPPWEGKSGLNFYADGMLQHDNDVGLMLKKLDDLGIADNTIVIYTTDNGPHYNMWPDGGITPFRSEKNTNWEGAFRVPFAIRWPGRIPAGQTRNEIASHLDIVPTLMAAAGEPAIKEKLLVGHQAGGRSYKVHLDGYNLLPMLTGSQGEWPRKEFFYWSDDGDLLAMRYQRYKLVFMEQRAQGMAVWRDPFVRLRAPLLFDLRMDPFERAATDANNYNVWWEAIGQIAAVPAQQITGRMVMTFKDFPPRQRPSSFSVDQILEGMRSAGGGG
jgi:arylsulfatase A-like enzyme